METPANSQPLQSISLSSRRRQALRQQTLSECFLPSSETDDARSNKRRKTFSSSSDPFSDDTDLTVPPFLPRKSKARTAKRNLATQLEALALGPSRSVGYSCRTYLETLASGSVDADQRRAWAFDPVYALANSNALKRGQHGFTVAASGHGRIMMLLHRSLEHPRPPLKTVASCQVDAHFNAIFTVAVSQSDRRIATASGDFSCRVFDSETRGRLAHLAAHTGSPRSITFAPDRDDIVVSGARDGCICIWDLRLPASDGCTAPAQKIRNAHDDVFARRPGRRPAGASMPSITGAAILPQNDHHLVSAASGDATVKLWDLRATRQLGKVHPVAAEQNGACPNDDQTRERGICKMMLSPEGNRAYSLGMDGVIRSYDPSYLSRPAGVLPTWTLPSPATTTFFDGLALSPCSRFLAVGTSHDGIIFVDTQSPHPGDTVVSTRGPKLEMAQALDWTYDGLLSGDDAGWVRRWRFDQSAPLIVRDSPRHSQDV